MTRDQIIHDLFTGKNFNDCISKMEPVHLQEDLKQEVIIVVCEMSHDKIVSLHTRKELEYFVVGIILNQIKSNTSPFFKKYRQLQYVYLEDVADVNRRTNEQSVEAISLEERELKELIEDMALAEIKAMRDTDQYWYEYGLIELYLKHQNFRAIAKETKIPFSSCYKTIKKALDQIRGKVYNDPAIVQQRIEYIKNNPLKL